VYTKTFIIIKEKRWKKLFIFKIVDRKTIKVFLDREKMNKL